MISEELEKNIMDCMPYSEPFRFIHKITDISDEHISGYYTFHKDEYFYRGHFPDFPVTPGVILTECMAQIGLVALGIHITRATPEMMKTVKILFSSSDVHFYQAVFPEQKVIVKSKKIYFRLKSLKCEVTMENEQGELVAKGTLAGVFDKE